MVVLLTAVSFLVCRNCIVQASLYCQVDVLNQKLCFGSQILLATGEIADCIFAVSQNIVSGYTDFMFLSSLIIGIYQYCPHDRLYWAVYRAHKATDFEPAKRKRNLRWLCCVSFIFL